MLTLTPRQIHPEIHPTFQRTGLQNGQWHFVSRCIPCYACPPFVITSTAMKYRKQGHPVDTAGYDDFDLWNVMNTTASNNQDVSFSFSEAKDFARIARSVLAVHHEVPNLNVNNWPVVGLRKQQSMRWLIYVVEGV